MFYIPPCSHCFCWQMNRKHFSPIGESFYTFEISKYSQYGTFDSMRPFAISKSIIKNNNNLSITSFRWRNNQHKFSCRMLFVCSKTLFSKPDRRSAFILLVLCLIYFEMENVKQAVTKSPKVEKCFFCIELKQGGLALGIFCILISFWPSIFIIFFALPGHICWFFGIIKVNNIIIELELCENVFRNDDQYMQ